jgi:HEPN domain-containing protein
MTRPPQWGNLVFHADKDILALGVLAYAQQYSQAFYHGTQAIEKYLKALYLSTKGAHATTDTEKCLRGKDGHDLVKLAQKCGQEYPYCIQDDVLVSLQRFAEFDQLARYPWVDQNHGNGFRGEDIFVIAEIARRLRNYIPIQIDNYPLGMEVRGYFHNSGKSDPRSPLYSHQAVDALRKVIPNINLFVRW